jgi:photosystem II stability/assembly factor-like uncharacterized protein
MHRIRLRRPVRLISLAALLASGSAPLLAQWKALGPFGGPQAIVQVDPNSSKTVLAGANSGLLFRSQDGGETWQTLVFPMQLRAALHTILIHPKIRGLYLAGISSEGPEASGLWRSADAGATWQPVPAFIHLQVRALATFRGDTLVMAAGTDRGVFRTSDGGNTWERISPAENRELQPVVSVAFDPKDRNVIYAGTPHLPWQTIDGGKSWKSIYNGMIDDSDVFAIVVDRNRPMRVFAGACSGVYRSWNRGVTWGKLPGSKAASYRTYTIVQDPQYENVLFAGTTNGMIRSADSGSTWARIAPYATRSIAFDMSKLGRIFIATDEAGIVRSDDNGATWKPVNRGICSRRLSPLVSDEAGSIYTGAVLDPAQEAVFVLPNGEDEWSSGKFPGAPLFTVTASRLSRGGLYAITQRGLVGSRDGGQSWASMKSPAGSEPLTDVLAPAWESGTILASAGSSIFFSRDAGKTWREAPFPAPIRSLTALDAPWVAAITSAGVYLSSDGESWRGSAPIPGGEAYGIVSWSYQRLLAATAGGLRISSNGGRSWQVLAGELAGNTIHAICRHPLRQSVLFAGSYGSVLVSEDDGRTWRKISPNDWPVDSVKQLVVAPGNPGRLLVLTPRQGVFALELERRGQTPTSDQRFARER